MADRGKLKGPTHEQGGISAVRKSDREKVAVVEGGERIFSVEDTAEMEKLSQAIGDLPEEEANLTAMQLGYRVSKMIRGQDDREIEGQERDSDLDAIINGTDEPDTTVDEYIS